MASPRPDAAPETDTGPSPIPEPSDERAPSVAPATARLEVGERPGRWASLLRSRRAAAIGLFAFYWLLSLAFDPAGYLTTDVGGKTAALAAMTERGDWSPDMGYWLEDALPGADPEARLYPYDNTGVTDDGAYVNTTSLTMVLGSRPLWELGGHRAILFWPIVGGVATALAAGGLERRFRARAGWRPGSGWRARWIVGLASPVVVYALDFWEHSLGLAAMATGVVCVLDVSRPIDTAGQRWSRLRSPAVSALAAGLCFGFAATMRQEALVYGLFAGLWLVGETWATARRVSVVAGRAAAMLVGTAVMIAAHLGLELAAVGSPMRTARATQTAEVAGLGLLERFEAALVTSLFPFNDNHPLSYVLGIGLLGVLSWGSLRVLSAGPARAEPVMAFVLKAVVLATAAVWLLFGLRFVPGLVPTTPLAVLGGWAAWRARLWAPLALAVAPLPLIYAVQFAAGAYVQWAGRYLLLSGLILVVSAVALVGAEGRDRPAGRWFWLLAAGGLAITAYGVGWRVARAHAITDGWAQLEAAADGDVVVWADTQAAREAGPIGVTDRWLGVYDDADRTRVAGALQALGVERFVYVWPAEYDRPAFEGYVDGDQVADLELLQYQVFEYHRAPAP